ncbi:MAG TPA: PDZ domain-containing protein [Thermoanaerobaculia bacterium]|nr:PDZ domain-containing protein [Thermoanaerobaculia bacterium]
MSSNALGEPASPTTFTVAMPEPATHVYEITMEIAPFKEAVSSFDLVMPVWAPGSYAVRDFARNVRDLEASEAPGRALAAEKVDKSRWRVRLSAPAKGPFTVRYRVYANELSVRTSHLDASHGYGNGTSLLFYVEGRKEEPQRLRFALPDGWKVSIALPESPGGFLAKDYDELVDSPFECGTHRTYDFTVRGVPHTLALWGSGNEDPERLVRDLTKIVEQAADVFGGLPYPRYLFLVHIAAGAGGGLEHRASQSDGVQPWRFKPEKSYRGVLTLFSHEFFHLWNVKRIHPAPLGPFDYTREVYTKDLWAMEGVTSYYQWVLLERAGVVKPKHFFEDLGKELLAHKENPGSAVQSAEMSSFDTWIRLYHPDENSPNVSESYYRRGALIGLALDLAIRRASGGTRSLDDVLRLLWREYGERGIGYPEGRYEEAVGQVLQGDAKELFDRYVRGVETPDLAKLLAPFGLELAEKAEKDEDEKDADEDKKNGNGETPAEPKSKADFGWKTAKQPDGRITISEVYAGRAAYRAGVNAGDELVAVDGVKADEDQLKRIERDVAPGTSVEVTVFRRARLEKILVALGSRRAFTYEIKAKKGATPEEKTMFKSWLGQALPEKEKAVPKKKARKGAAA